MKLGVSAFNWSRTFEASDFQLLPRIREAGFAAFEVPIFDPDLIDVKPLRRALESNDLACTVCAILTNGINPISSDAAQRRKAREHLALCIETTAALGGRLLGGPLYATMNDLPGRLRNQDEWRWAVDCFQSLGELLEKHAITLALEPVNRSETYFLTTAAEAAQLCEEIGNPSIGVLLDTFHANIEEKNIAAVIRSLGPRLKHVHVSENDRGVPGSGHIDFAEMMRALRAIAYDGYVVIEGLGYIPPEKNSPDFMWRRPEETPEAIVFEGAAFLKTLI
jgi:D-psicose/D-tagatose/L-ribulose 3-epimerase